MIDGKKCKEIIEYIMSLSEENMNKLFKKITDIKKEKNKKALGILGANYNYKNKKELLPIDYIEYLIDMNNREIFLEFILTLKQKIKFLKEENNRLSKLEKKMLHLDDIIQQEIFQKLKEYEDKINKLKKENEELKERLGYYE